MMSYPEDGGPPVPYDEMPEHPGKHEVRGHVGTEELGLARSLSEQLATIAHQNALAESIADRLVTAFSPHFEKAHALVEQAKHITADPKVARAMRLSVREVRLAAENTRKSFKEGIVREGKAIDGICNVVKLLIEPVEERLENIEKAAERLEAKRKQDLLDKRAGELSPLGVNPHFYNLMDMPEEQYQELLATSTAAHEELQRQAEAASIERQRAEHAAREEAERTRLENVRLKAERDAAAAEAKRVQDAAAAEAKRVQEKADAVIEQHRQARAKAEADLKREQAAKKKKVDEEAAAAAKAARAPDRDKLLAYAEALRTLPLPSVASSDADALHTDIMERIDQLVTFIRQRCREL